MGFAIIGAIVLGVIALITVVCAITWRVVVPTNDVHIVQSGKATISYGREMSAGNVYYSWPSWVPSIGVRVSVLPVSVFSISLKDYEAYDLHRLPFKVDVTGFFRIGDSNVAAQRVSSAKEMTSQLENILQGAIRRVLGTSELSDIMEGRGKFGEMFTKEVDENLKEWGIQTVKCVELMDIRDAHDSKVISDIMAKKKSQIDMESRVEVAKNAQTAQSAEIVAKRQIAVAAQEAEESVGKRTADKEATIGIAKEKAQQQIKDEAKTTAEKDMAVTKVKNVQAAEINKEVALVEAAQSAGVTVVNAEAAKKTSVIAAQAQAETTVIRAQGEKSKLTTEAEGEKAKLTTIAEGTLSATKMRAEGISAEGKAKGEAETAILMAPVTTQTTLAEKIGSNKPYQDYLITIRTIEKDEKIGTVQAEALKGAGIKVLANAGTPMQGLNSVMELFTSKGGAAVAQMLETLGNTDAGKGLLDKLGVSTKDDVQLLKG